MTSPVQQSRFERIVSNLDAGVVVVGLDRRIAWANGAALAMHGVTTVDQLGHDVAGYRANYAFTDRDRTRLGDGDAPVDRLVAGEAFHGVVVDVTRTGRDRADWVHSIRGCVPTGPDGEPECRVLIITDVTEQYEAERRFQAVMEASLAPAAICRLSDLRFVAVNRSFLDMTGYVEGDVIGRSLCAVDVLKGAERRDLAIERLNVGGVIPQMEACLAVPADASKRVIVAGRPIEMPGKVPCMLFTFADLEARRKAEADLKQSQEQFEKSFQLSPVPTVRGRRDGVAITDVNEAFTAMFGYRVEDMRQHKALEAGLWADQPARERFERRLRRDGTVRGYEGTLRTREGQEIDCLMSADTVEIGGDLWILCTIQDVTERRRSEAELKRAIEHVITDASWFSQKILDKLASLRTTSDTPPSPGGLDDLTAREREILIRVAQGATDTEIVEEFRISRNTVRNHLTALYRKLGVNRRSAVVVFARERGLVDAQCFRRSA